MAFGGDPNWQWQITIAVLCEAYPQFMDFIQAMSYISTGYRNADGAITIGRTKFVPVMPPWDLSRLPITGAISLVGQIDMNYILTEWLQRYTNSQVGMWAPASMPGPLPANVSPRPNFYDDYKRVMDGLSKDMALALASTKAALPPAPELKPECVERDIEI